MKLGFPLRRLLINSKVAIKILLTYFSYFLWILFDPSKFRIINKSKIKSILIIGRGAVGDMYVITGFLNKLNKKYPQIKIYLLAKKKDKKFVKNPQINVVGKKKLINLIKRKKIDSLINLGISIDKDLYFKILKIPYRIKTCSPYNHLFKQSFFYTRRVFPIYLRKIYQYQKSFKFLGFDIDSIFHFTKEGEKEAIKFMKKHKITKKEKIIFIHPAGGRTVKSLKVGKISASHWPPTRWATLIDHFIEKYNARVILDGIAPEKIVIDEILSKIKKKNKKKTISAIDLSLEAVGTLFTKSDLLITIHTCTSVVAFQTKINYIDLFGPFSPLIAKNFKNNKNTFIFHPEVCNNCQKQSCPEENPICMNSISTKEIIRNADKFLKKKR